MYQSFGPLAALVLVLGILGYIVQSRLPPPKPKVIGIDLGTTYSAVGIYNAVYGNVTVVEDADGKKVIPSVVAFLEDSILVGYSATQQAEKNPRRTVYDAKRFIGKVYKDMDLFDRHRKPYSFEVTLDTSGSPLFVTEQSGRLTYKTPEDIGGIVLRTLRRTAERALGIKVTKAVISVPAEFNQLQRNATILAGKSAGLDVLRVINEPTAAAMAYGLHKKSGVNLIIVVDFGGGTLDVSLLRVQGGMFVTLAMAGNNRLGGQDINENMFQYFQGELNKELGCMVIQPEDLQNLRDEVERAKLDLTIHTHTFVSIQISNRLNCKSNLSKNAQYDNTIKLELTRDKFEQINKEVFRKLLMPIDRVLEEASFEASEVDEIVLVGGSTRIPKVREIIENYFNKKPNVEIDPDIAVVTGVAVQAGILGGAWPLQVAAIEVHRTDLKKIEVSDNN